MRFGNSGAVYGMIVFSAALAACGGGGVDSTAPPRGDIATVTLAPTSATIGVGSSAPFDAVIVSTAGDTLRSVAVSWSSSDVDIARVSSAGVVTAVAVGTAKIAATVQGRSATANVSVVPMAVASVQLSPLELQVAEGARGTVTVRVLDAQGRVLTGRAVQWRSSNTSVATVSTGGSVTGVGAGSATIIATSEGHSASIAVAVSPVAVASVAIAPSSTSVMVGAARQFTAEVRDASGAVLPGRTVVWSTNSPSIVSVSSTGNVVGVAPGTAQVTVSSGGRSASATVTVQSAPAPVVVGRVTVSPTSATLASSGTSDRTVRLDANAYRRDSNGEWVLIPDATFAWTTSNSNIAIVDANGLVTALAPGRATIIATSGTQLGTAEITVEAPAPPPIVVGRVTVSPNDADIRFQGPVGRTVQLTARAFVRDEEEWVLVRDASFVWSSSNPTVATVSSTGLVRGESEGAVTITATSGGQSGTARIEVRRR